MIRPGRFKWGIAALGAAGLAALPFMCGSYHVRTAADGLFYLVLAQSFHLVGGKTGYLNLGQGVFVGLGAYATGLLVRAGLPILPALFLPAIAGTAAALCATPFFFRLGKEAFALANLALLYLCLSLAGQLREITGGTDGLYLPGAGYLNTAFFGLSALSLAAVLTAVRLPGTRTGYQAALTGTDPAMAEAFGVATLRVRCRLFTLGAFSLTLAGGFFMLGQGYVVPSTVFGLEVSLLPVAMAMAGGMNRPLGALWGTAVIFIFKEWLWLHAGGMEQTLLGLMLIFAGKRYGRERKAFTHPFLR